MCSNKVREEVDLSAVAAALPDSCTGADLLQVVSTARAAAVRALVAKLHAGKCYWKTILHKKYLKHHVPKY